MIQTIDKGTGKTTTRIEVNTADFPRCALCETVVEDFYILELDNEIILVVECHKSRETVKLNAEDLAQLDEQTIRLDWAFQNEGLC